MTFQSMQNGRTIHQTLAVLLGTIFLAVNLVFSMEEAEFQRKLSQVSRLDEKSVKDPELLDAVLVRLEKQPESDRLHEAAGILLHFQQNHGEAVDQLSKIGNHTRNSRRILALSLYEMGEFEKSISHFEKVANIGAEKQEWEKFIDALIRTGKKKEAAQEYSSYLARYPGEVKALEFLADYYREPLQSTRLAGILEKLHQVKKDDQLLLEIARLYENKSYKAIEYREKYLEKNPKDVDLAIELAQLYEEQGNKSKALALYSKHADRRKEDFKFNKHLGDLYSEFLKREMAAEYYRRALAAKPDDIDLTLQLARLYEQLGEKEKAISSYAMALKVKPEDKQLQEKMISLLSEKGREKQLEAQLEIIQQRDPKAHKAQYLLATIHARTGRDQSAYEYLNKALENDPKNREYQQLLPQVVKTDEQIAKHFDALVSLAQGQSDAGLWLLVARGYSNQKETKKAGEAFAKVLQSQPSLLNGRKDAVIALYEIGEFKSAADLAEKYLQKDPSDVRISEIRVESLEKSKAGLSERKKAMAALLSIKPDDPNRWLELARLTLETKDTAAAINHATNHIRLKPDEVDGHKFLVPLLRGKKGGEQALATSLEALSRLDEKNQESYRKDLALLQARQGRCAEALDLFEAMKKSQAKDADFWFWYGTCQKQMNNMGGALASYEKAFQLDSDNPKYARAFAEGLKGQEDWKNNLKLYALLYKSSPTLDEKIAYARSLFYNEDFKKSSQIWDEVLQSKPNIATEDSTVGISYLKAGRNDKAKLLYLQLYKARPGDPDVVEVLANLHNPKQEPEQYMNYLEKLVELDPQRKDYQLKRAEAYVERKKFQQALRDYHAWALRNPKDLGSWEKARKLATQLKDTASLIEILPEVTKLPNAPAEAEFQFAELNFKSRGDVSALEEFVKKHPSNKEAKTMLVMHYAKNNEISRLKPFESFLADLAKKNPALYGVLARVQTSGNKITAAHDSYLAWVKAAPKNRAHFDEAYRFTVEQKGGHQKELLEIGTNSFPQDMELKRQYAEILGDSPQALQVYQVILKNQKDPVIVEKAARLAVKLKDDKAALPLLEQWVGMDPSQEFPLIELSRIYSEKGDQQKYAIAQEKLSELQPDNPKQAVKAANAWRKLKNLDKALWFYRRALDHNPKDAGLKKETAMLLLKQKNFFDAQQLLEDAVKSLPKDEEIRYSLYKIYRQNKMPEEAVNQLRELHKLNPAEKKYAYPLAQLEANMNNPEGTVVALSNDKVREGMKKKLSFLLLDALIESEKKKEAAEWGEVLVKRFPNEAGSSLTLAKLHLAQDDKKQAFDVLGNVLKKKPSPEAHYLMGQLQLEKGEWSQAASHFQQSLSGNFPKAQYLLGRALLEAQKWDAAIQAFESDFGQRKNPDALKGIYQAQKGKKDVTGQIGILNRLINAFPKEVEYQAELAQIYADQGEDERAMELFSGLLKKNPKDPEANVFMGIFLAKKGDFKASEKYLIQGLQTKKSAKGYHWLAKGHEASKDHKQALQAYETALKLDNKHLGAALGRAKQLKILGQKDKLPGAYKTIIALDSNNAEAAYGLAEWHYARKEYKKAGELYHKIRGQQSGNQEFWAHYGHCLLELNQTQDAKKALERAHGLGQRGEQFLVQLARLQLQEKDVNQAEQTLSDVLQTNSENHEAYFWLGKIAMERGQSGVAKEYMTQAISYDKKNRRYAEGLAEVLYNMGQFNEVLEVLKPFKDNLSLEGQKIAANCLFNRKQYKPALVLYEQILQKDKSGDMIAKAAETHIALGDHVAALALLKNNNADNPLIPIIKSQVQLSMGQLEQAEKTLEDAGSKTKQLPKYYIALGRIYARDGEFKDAARTYEKALSYESDYPESHYEAGMAYLKAEKEREAKTHFDQLTQHTSSEWQAKGYMGLALMFERQQKFEAMEYHLQKAAELRPTGEYLGLLAQAALELNKLDEAKGHADEALQKDPGNPEATVALAEVMFRQKKSKESIGMLRNALKDNPKECKLLVALAKHNFLAGNDANTKTFGQQAIEMCPDSADPHLYVGVVAEKAYQEDLAKQHFRSFRKLGGSKERLEQIRQAN